MIRDGTQAPALGVQSLSHQTTREESILILLHGAFQFCQYHLLKRKLFFVHCIFLPLLLQINCPCKCRFVSGLYSVPLIYVSVFILAPYCFDFCCFVVQFEIKKPGTVKRKNRTHTTLKLPTSFFGHIPLLSSCPSRVKHQRNVADVQIAH